MTAEVPADIQAALDVCYTPEEAAQWLSLPHPQLDGVTPLDAIQFGRALEVRAIIERLSDCAYL